MSVASRARALAAWVEQKTVEFCSHTGHRWRRGRRYDRPKLVILDPSDFYECRICGAERWKRKDGRK